MDRPAPDWLDRLIAPHPTVTAEDARRQVRLFLAAVLSILLTTLLGVVSGYLGGRLSGALTGTAVMAGIVLLLALAYALGRSPRYFLGFLLATATLCAAPYTTVWLRAADRSPDASAALLPGTLIWTAPALVFAAIWLPTRTLAALAAANLCAALAATLWLTGPEWPRHSAAVGLAAATGALVVISRLHAERLERLRRQALEAARDLLEQRVEERTEHLARLNGELRLARQAAEEAFRNRSSYLAEVSHDLRTPLTIILGFSEMLNYQAQAQGDDETSRHLSYIETSARYLVDLSKNLIDLARLERGEVTIEPQPVWLPDLLEEVLLLGRPLVAKNHNVLDSDLGDDLGEMHTDPLRLRQILINLLSNAGKFTENGTVHLSARRSVADDGAAWITFVVRDTGVGLSPAQLKALFQPYPPSFRATRERYSGSGLGLAITHMLCTYLGGTVSAASEMDRGATFTVRLPAVLSGPVTAPGMTTAGAQPAATPAVELDNHSHPG